MKIKRTVVVSLMLILSMFVLVMPASANTGTPWNGLPGEHGEVVGLAIECAHELHMDGGFGESCHNLIDWALMHVDINLDMME